MRRRIRLRPLLAILLALLLLPVPAGLASPFHLTEVPVSDQPIPEPDLAQPVDTTPGDRGLQLLGTASQVEALRQQLAEANLAPTQVPAEQHTVPTGLHTGPAARPAEAPVAGTAAAPKTAQAQPAKVVDVRSSAAGVTVSAATYGYTLAQNREFYLHREAATLELTLTNAGAPVMGATVRFSGQETITDAYGIARFPFTAPGHSDVYPILVTVGSLVDAPLGRVYVVNQNEGVLVVNNVTDRTGATHASFQANVYNPAGTWGRPGVDGTAEFLLPVGQSYVEVLLNGSTGAHYLYQSATINMAQKTVLHPSGSNAVPLNVSVTRGTSVLDGAVNVRNTEIPHTTWSNQLPTSLWVTPGTYVVGFRSDEAEPVLLVDNGVPVYEAKSLTLQAELASQPVAVEAPQGVRSFTAAAFQTSLWVPLPAARVHVQPGLDHFLHSYHGYQAAGSDMWQYYYTAFGRAAWSDADPVLRLGGEPAASLPSGTVDPGVTLWAGTALRTSRGDQLLVRVGRNGGPEEEVYGTLTLRNSDGASLHSQSVSTYMWGTHLTVPQTAAGTLTLALDYPNLGPLHGPFHQESSLNVYTPPVWRLTLSDDELSPGEQATITATVTRDGQPAADTNVKLCLDSCTTYYTGADGTVALPVTAPNRRAVLNVWAYTGQASLLAEIYVVPKGYGVLRVTDVTDRTGKRLQGFEIGAVWYSPERNSWDSSGEWAHGGARGMVRPVGTNDLRIKADGGSTGESYFLYRQVTITEGQRTEVALSGAETVRLDVAVSLNGTAAPSPRIHLHNRQMSWFSWEDSSLPNTAVYVTPGRYNITAEGHSPQPTVLSRQDVSLTADTALTFAEQTAGLATLTSPQYIGQNTDVWLNSVWTELNGFVLRVYPTAVLVTPGLTYRVNQYSGNQSQWQYSFMNCSSTDQVTPAAGQSVPLPVGGALWMELKPNTTELRTGATVWFNAAVFTPSRHQINLQENGQYVPGTLRLKTKAGTVLWSRNVYTYEGAVQVTLPGTAGDYILEAWWDKAGPYQSGQVGAASSFYVAGPEGSLNLSVSPRTVPVGVPTPVTMTVTNNGAPAPGLRVSMLWYGEKITDSNGQVTFTVNESWAWALEVVVADQNYSTLVRSNLFVLGPGEAGVQISANDAQGKTLTNYWASGQVTTSSGSSRYSTGGQHGPLGVIVPAGDAFVQVVREGADAYVLNTTVPVAAGTVTAVHLDGAAVPTVPVSALLDSQPVGGGWVSLYPAGKGFTSTLKGLALDGSGTGQVHITPGQYEVLLTGPAGEANLIARLGSRAVSNTPISIAVQRSNLASLEVGGHLAGVPVTGWVTLRALPFELRVPYGSLLVTPGSFTAPSSTYDLQQPGGSVWRYELTQDTAPTLTAQAGAAATYNWDLRVASATAQLKTTTYTAGSRISYRFDASTPSGWRYSHITDPVSTWQYKTQIGVNITDAAGTSVLTGTMTRSYWRDWTTPATPSPSYTFAMNWDMGALGSYTASAKAQQASPAGTDARLTVDRFQVLAGQITPVRISLVKAGRPVANAWVRIAGETVSWERTDSRGQLILSLKPTRAGVWTLSYTDTAVTPSKTTYAYVYAMGPGYGLVTLGATDRTGKPMQGMFIRSISGGKTVASNPSGDERRILLPAGPAQLVIRAYSSAMENYYLVVDTTVPDMGSMTLPITTAGLPAIMPLLTNQPTGSTAVTTLRNTAVDFTEWYAMPISHANGKPTWVTPGIYEALITVNDGTSNRYLPLPSMDLRTASNLPTVDVATATAELLPQATDAQGDPASGAVLQLTYGRLGTPSMTNNPSRVLVKPGTWNVAGASFTKLNSTGDELWQYHFTGQVPLNAVAGSQTVQIGGALTATVAPAQPLVRTGGTVGLLTRVREQLGLDLNLVRVYNASTGAYLGYAPGSVTVTGPGYNQVLTFTGSNVPWSAPGTAGTYSLRMVQPMGPYGADAEATGSVQVTGPRR